MKDTFTIDKDLLKLNFKISILEMQIGIHKSTRSVRKFLDAAIESKD